MSPTSISKGRSRPELQAIDIHSPENLEGPDFARLATFLAEKFPSVEVRIRPTATSLVRKKEIEIIARRFASARVKDLSAGEQTFEPMFGEVDYEERAICGEARVGGIVYEGRKLEEIYGSLLGKKADLRTAAIVLTDRLVSTYSRDDLRHHLRTVVCDFPSIVSIPGIVEAPAKPREYYLMKQQMGGLEDERLKSSFKGRFIDYGDEMEIADVLEGLSLQCLMYHLTLDPFCDDAHCRMFNAHWQEDLIRTQVKEKMLCGRHERLLGELGKKPILRW